ncbi:MAG: STT3 domain-containing protein [Nanoarchaeota archaeon]
MSKARLRRLQQNSLTNASADEPQQKETAAGKHAPQKKESDDEFSFDFSRKKKAVQKAAQKGYTKEKEPNEKEQKEQDEEEFSFGTGFLSIVKDKRFLSTISIILLILIAVLVSAYFRSYPNTLPITKDWATNNVNAYYRSQISAQVNQQYPNLPQQSKNEIIDKQYAEFYASNKDQIDKNIQDARSFFLQNFKDENGQTYILNIDSFYFFRRAQNIITKGHYYDTLEKGVPWDDHMLAPKGLATEADFHSYFAVYLYKAWHVLNQNITLTSAAFSVSVILASLSTIPVFFIVRKKVGNFGGFFAALLLAIHPVFLGRSSGGDFDNDVYNVFFPVIISWIFLETFEAKSQKKRVILSLLNSLVIGIFAFAWRGGWWYIFDFIVGVIALYIWYILAKKLINQAVEKDWLKMSEFWTRLILFILAILLAPLLIFYLFYILYTVLRHFKRRQSLPKEYLDVFNTFILLLIFIAASALFVTLFNGWRVFITGPLSPIRITSLLIAAKPDLWPNVYTTVAELNQANLSGVVSQIASFGEIGNKYNLFFLVACLGVIFGLVKKKIDWKDLFLLGFSIIYYLIITTPAVLALPKTTYLLLFVIPIIVGLFLLLKDETVDVKYAVFLILWFVATIYAGTKGIRFITLLVPAFVIAFGVAVGRIYSILSDLVRIELRINKHLTKAIFAILFLLLLINPLKAADGISRNAVPVFDRPWYEAIGKIKADSKPDAIINSWWDFGHFFKAIADRRVTFDGAIQNTPPAHWIGKVLATGEEDQAVSILRMLDCGQNDAYDLVNAKLQDTVTSVDLVNALILLDKAHARTLLQKQGFDETSSEFILVKTHCAPPEDYFITSGDMTGKAGVWAHFGSWNFKKAYIYTTAKRNSRQETVTLLTEKFNMSAAEAEQYYFEVQGITDERDANSWISPWPGYVTSQTLGCGKRTENNTVECAVNLGLGQSGQGQTVLERVVIDLTEMNNSYILMSVVQGNSKLGSAQQKPNAFVITTPDSLKKISFADASFPYDILVDTYHGRMLIIDPLLSTSTYTKLFYLDGMYMTHFDKVFEKQSMTQGNIIVWKVDWNGKTEEELNTLKSQWFPEVNETAPVPNQADEEATA